MMGNTAEQAQALALDLDALDQYLTAVVEHYERNAPRVSRWANELYVRVNEAPERVTLAELRGALALCEAGVWEHPNYAQNRIYKMLDRLGQDTTGWLDF